MCKMITGTITSAVVMVSALMMSSTAWATLTGATGRINGHPPVISGQIYMTGPALSGTGRMTLTDPNTTYDMSPTARGIDYSVSNDTSGITVTDSDGDAVSTVSLSGSSAMQTWTYSEPGGEEKPVPDADLQQPFYPRYAGKKLSLVPAADVTATTLTGIPDSGTRAGMTGSAPFRLSVPPLTLHITGLTVTKDNAIADTVDKDTVSATVVDAYGTPQPGVAMTFIQDTTRGFLNYIVTSGTDGQVTAEIRSPNNSGAVLSGFKNTVFAYVGTTFQTSPPPGSPVTEVHFVWIPSKSSAGASPSTINTTQTTTVGLLLKNADASWMDESPILTTAPLTGTAAAGATISAWTKSGRNIYATLTPGASTGTITVMPLVSGFNAVTTPVTVTVVPAPDNQGH